MADTEQNTHPVDTELLHSLDSLDASINDRLKEKAEALFNKDMKDTGGSLPWAKANERIRQLYYQGARAELMNDMIAAQITKSDMPVAVETRNDVTIGHNSPDMIKFVDTKGEELFTIHKTVAGDVDITLNADLKYTDAALIFLQIAFEHTTKLRFLNFSRALEFMKKKYRVRSIGNPEVELYISDSGVAGSLGLHDWQDIVLWDDFEVVDPYCKKRN